MLLKRRQYEMKGPQASDIMPVFRMTKAQPITNYSGTVRRVNRGSSHESQSRGSINLINDDSMAQRHLFMKQQVNTAAVSAKKLSMPATEQRARNQKRTSESPTSDNNVMIRIMDLK